MHLALELFLSALLALIFVDFLSGVFHWLEDSYGSPDMPVLGRYVTKPNILHHHHPREFTKSPFWRRNRVTWAITAIIILPIAASGHFNGFWAFVAAFGAMSNEIHCWAHRSPQENGALITALQRLRLIQSPRGHAIHHTDPKRDAYCVMTDFLNPLLDRSRFFRVLEKGILLIFRLAPRPDSSLSAVSQHLRRGVVGAPE